MPGSKASHAESASTIVEEENTRKDNGSGKGFKLRIFQAPKSGRVIQRIDILREGWSNRVFKDLNSKVDNPHFPHFPSVQSPCPLIYKFEARKLTFHRK